MSDEAKGLTAAVRTRRNSLVIAKPTLAGPGQCHEGLGKIYFWETGIKFEVGQGVKSRTILFLGTARIDSTHRRGFKNKKNRRKQDTKKKKKVFQERR